MSLQRLQTSTAMALVWMKQSLCSTALMVYYPTSSSTTRPLYKMYGLQSMQRAAIPANEVSFILATNIKRQKQKI